MQQITTDNIAKDDLLGRRKFAGQIVDTLHNSFLDVSESYVVGICGKWGSGKSTLLDYIGNELKIKYIDNPTGLRIINFNSWEITGLDSIQKSLLQKIINDLRHVAEDKKLKKLNKKAKNIARFFGRYLPFAKNLHPFADALINAIDAYAKNTTLASLEELRAKANDLIVSGNIKMFVFIDDLDRLSPDEIISVFKVIKLNANFKNTIFLVAYDKSVVIEALRSQFHNNAESYLEKIIQVDFVVPEITEEKIENIFFKSLKEISIECIGSYNEQDIYPLWKYHGLNEYFNTIRDVKRYFNTLIFSFPNIAKEVNTIDYLILEAIKVFDYDAYEKIYIDFITKMRLAIFESASFDEALIATTYKNQTTQSLLRYLFIKGNGIEAALNQKRLRDRIHFRRYYSLYIPSTEVSDSELRNFLTTGTNKNGVLREITQQDRLINFLRLLADRELKNNFNIDDQRILSEFLYFFDNYDSLNSTITEYAWHAYFNLIHSFTKEFDVAKAGVRKLFLSDHSYQPLKFYINHFLVIIKDEGRSEPQFYGVLQEQLTLSYQEIKETFIKYMANAWQTYFLNILSRRDAYIAKLFVYSFSKHCQEDYRKALKEYLPMMEFKIFLLDQFFILYKPQSDIPNRLILDYMQQLLPGNSLSIFKEDLKTLLRGTVNRSDQAIVDYFLLNIGDYKY